MAPVCAVGSYTALIGAEKENPLGMMMSTHHKLVRGDPNPHPPINPVCGSEGNAVTVSCICNIIVAAVCVITATDTKIFRAGCDHCMWVETFCIKQ